MSDIVTCAQGFTTRAHASINQRRKYTGEPYIVHPAAVVEIVRSVPHDDAMLAVAWLHDVEEDIAPTRPEFGMVAIDRQFGFDVADLVAWLTDVSTPTDGNRAARKAIDRRHIAAAPARAQTIKVADLIHNTATIVQHDPNFAPIYLAEKRALLEVLTKADPMLAARAREQCKEAVIEDLDG